MVQLGERHVEAYLSTLPEDFRPHAERYVRQFLDQGFGDGGRESLDRHFAWCRARYTSGTVRHVWGILRTFYRRNGLAWPYRPSETPPESDLDQFRPALDSGLVWEMISAAKEAGPREAFYLAVSSTYGCRVGELAALQREHVDLGGGLIFIHTEKHGRQRYHRIPEEIRPFVARYLPRLRPVSEKSLERLWRRLEDLIGMEHVERVGWHAVRRKLDQLLLDSGVSEADLASFLRWKSSGNMVRRYAVNQTVGRDGSVQTLSGREQKVDERVFRVHPFLPAWR